MSWECSECKALIKYSDIRIFVNKQRLAKGGLRLASTGFDVICESCSKTLCEEARINNKNIIDIEITWGNRMAKYRFDKLNVVVPFYHKIGTPVLNVLRTTYNKIKKEFTS